MVVRSLVVAMTVTLSSSAFASSAHAFARLGCFFVPNAHRPIEATIRELDMDIVLEKHGEDRACAFLARGLLYHQESDYSHAIADYTRAIDSTPDYGDAYAARGDAYEDLGQHDNAARDYALAQQLSSDSAEELTQRCWVRALRGRPLARALEDCNTSLREQPDDFNALSSRALVYLRMNAYPAAIADCDAALKLKPQNASALYIRGLAKARAGDAQGAGADLAAARSASDKVEGTFAIFGLHP